MEITKLDELNGKFFDLMRRADAIRYDHPIVNPFFDTDLLWSEPEFRQEGNELYRSLVARVQEDSGNLDVIALIDENTPFFSFGPSPFGSRIAPDEDDKTKIVVFHYVGFGKSIVYPASVPFKTLFEEKNVLALTDVVYDTVLDPNIQEIFEVIRRYGGNIKGLAALVVYQKGTEGDFDFTKRGFDVPVYASHYVVKPAEPQQMTGKIVFN